MDNSRISQLYDVCILLLLGLLMSPMSTLVFNRVLGIPFVAPELLYLPILYKYQKFGISFIKDPNYFSVITLISIFYIIAIFLSEFNIVAISSTARCFALLFFFFNIGKCVNIDINFFNMLLWISFGSIIGWCLNNYLILGTSIYLQSNGILYGNMIAIPIAFSLSLITINHYQFFLGLILMNVYLCTTTGLRRQVVVSILSLLISLLLFNIYNLKIKYIIFSGLFILLLISIYPSFSRYLEENNSFMYERIIKRTEKFYEGNSTEGDQTRSNNLFKFLTDIDELIIPHGFVSFQTTKDGKGIFVDSPTYMLSYTFGFFPFLIYILYYIKRLLACFLKVIRGDSFVYSFIFITSGVVLFLHFVESSMFSFSFCVPMTGLVIGLLFRDDETLNIFEEEL